DQASAYIENSTVTATNGDVDVLAGYQKPKVLPDGSVSLLSAGTVTLPTTLSQALVSIAVGGADRDKFALGGAVEVNLLRGSADAHITASTAGKEVKAGGAVVVAANDIGAIGSLAGGLGISTNSAALGAAVSTNDIANTVKARIENVTVTGSQVQVTAHEGSYIVNLTIGGGRRGHIPRGRS